MLLLLLLLLFDWNWFKGPVERRVEAATGRMFRIEGDLEVKLAVFRPTIIATHVVLGNADWAKEPEMLRVERAEVQWAVWHMLDGDVVLPQVRLAGPELRLEREAKGRVNWKFSSTV